MVSNTVAKPITTMVTQSTMVTRSFPIKIYQQIQSLRWPSPLSTTQGLKAYHSLPVWVNTRQNLRSIIVIHVVITRLKLNIYRSMDLIGAQLNSTAQSPSQDKTTLSWSSWHHQVPSPPVSKSSLKSQLLVLMVISCTHLILAWATSHMINSSSISIKVAFPPWIAEFTLVMFQINSLPR